MWSWWLKKVISTNALIVEEVEFHLLWSWLMESSLIIKKESDFLYGLDDWNRWVISSKVLVDEKIDGSFLYDLDNWRRVALSDMVLKRVIPWSLKEEGHFY